MNDHADNPYAAPRAEPKPSEPVPMGVYVRAGIEGLMGFAAALSVGFWLSFKSILPVLDGAGWRGPLVTYSVLAAWIVLAVLAGIVAGRRALGENADLLRRRRF